MQQRSAHCDVYSTLPPPEHNGWIKDGEDYTIDWEDVEVATKIRGAITFLMKGCSCKKDVLPTTVVVRKNSIIVDPGVSDKVALTYFKTTII